MAGAGVHILIDECSGWSWLLLESRPLELERGKTTRGSEAADMKWFDEEAVTVQHWMERCAWYFVDQGRKRAGTSWRPFVQAFLGPRQRKAQNTRTMTKL